MTNHINEEGIQWAVRCNETGRFINGSSSNGATAGATRAMKQLSKFVNSDRSLYSEPGLAMGKSG